MLSMVVERGRYEGSWHCCKNTYPVTNQINLTVLSKKTAVTVTFITHLKAPPQKESLQGISLQLSFLICCETVAHDQSLTNFFCVNFSETGSTNCTTCDVGHFANETGSSSCYECSPGTFQNETGQSDCVQCPQGQYQDTDGQTSCKDCPKGTSQDHQGQPSCEDCLPGSFQNLTGQSTCLKCPPGHSQSGNGSTTCDLCPQNSYCRLKPYRNLILTDGGKLQTVLQIVEIRPNLICPSSEPTGFQSIKVP